MPRTGPAICEREGLNDRQDGNIKRQHSEGSESHCYEVKFQEFESSQLDCHAATNRGSQ